LAEGGKRAVRVWRNPDCGLFFYDATADERGRWWGAMGAVCGNRHSLASFAKNTQAKGGGKIPSALLTSSSTGEPVANRNNW